MQSRRSAITRGAFIEELHRLIGKGEQFIVIACFGVYYRTMPHEWMPTQTVVLKPKLIIVHSIFSRAMEPLILIPGEPTAKQRNPITDYSSKSEDRVRVTLELSKAPAKRWRHGSLC